MSQKLEKKIRKQIRSRMSHEFELLKQVMKPQPPRGELIKRHFVSLMIALVPFLDPRKAWEYGLRIYFKKEVDYNPNKRHALTLPGVVAGGGEEDQKQENPGQ